MTPTVPWASLFVNLVCIDVIVSHLNKKDYKIKGTREQGNKGSLKPKHLEKHTQKKIRR